MAMRIRIRIILCADQNDPLCTQQTKEKRKDDFFLFVSVWMKKRIAAAILISRVTKIAPRNNRKQNKEEVHSKIGPPASRCG